MQTMSTASGFCEAKPAQTASQYMIVPPRIKYAMILLPRFFGSASQGRASDLGTTIQGKVCHFEVRAFALSYFNRQPTDSKHLLVSCARRFLQVSLPCKRTERI
jgi:hypothetical protein